MQDFQSDSPNPESTGWFQLCWFQYQSDFPKEYLHKKWDSQQFLPHCSPCSTHLTFRVLNNFQHLSGLKKKFELDLDNDEFISVVKMDLKKLIGMIKAGKITDSKTICAVMVYAAKKKLL